MDNRCWESLKPRVLTRRAWSLELLVGSVPHGTSLS